MKVTALLGAGAFIDIGGKSTYELTESVIQHRLNFRDMFNRDFNEPFLSKIADELNDFWEPEKCNFEDILDALEKLYSFRLYGRDPKYFKPSLGAFIAPRKDKREFFNRDYLELSIRDMVTIIADSVEVYDSAFQPKNRDQWFTLFWQEAVNRCEWDIATLNYDTCIEQSLISFEDGFENTGKGYYRFNPVKLRDACLPRILHLHGCILYGYPEDYVGSFFERDHEELYKYKNYDDAKQSWNKRPISTTQSHEAAMIGPLITGLGKTDKLTVYPYVDYNHVFYESLLQNDSLFIAGYSFGDFHFNKMLERIAYLPKNKKIVIITYCDISDFSWNKKGCLKKLSRMEEFIIKNIKSDLPFKDSLNSPLESKDGRLRLYFDGLKNALEQDGKSIIDFLTL